MQFYRRAMEVLLLLLSALLLLEPFLFGLLALFPVLLVIVIVKEFEYNRCKLNQ